MRLNRVLLWVGLAYVATFCCVMAIGFTWFPREVVAILLERVLVGGGVLAVIVGLVTLAAHAPEIIASEKARNAGAKRSYWQRRMSYLESDRMTSLLYQDVPGNINYSSYCYWRDRRWDRR